MPCARAVVRMTRFWCVCVLGGLVAMLLLLLLDCDDSWADMGYDITSYTLRITTYYTSHNCWFSVAVSLITCMYASRHAHPTIQTQWIHKQVHLFRPIWSFTSIIVFWLANMTLGCTAPHISHTRPTPRRGTPHATHFLTSSVLVLDSSWHKHDMRVCGSIWAQYYSVWTETHSTRVGRAIYLDAHHENQQKHNTKRCPADQSRSINPHWTIRQPMQYISGFT